jgi:hypothetical protein
MSVIAEPSELENRVAALETQVQDLTKRVQHSEHDTAPPGSSRSPTCSTPSLPKRMINPKG